jgi:hypothetical protein
MFNETKKLKCYILESRDGPIGKVKEFYFDDEHWTVRYLVADTGSWLTGRQVLISPYALEEVNQDGRYVGVNLTRKQIENSPSLSSDKPVSKQFEESYFDFYRYPVYWSGSYLWGYSPYLNRDPENWLPSYQNGRSWDPHLRSTHDVIGHHVEATDGMIGHVCDFILDDASWEIHYLVVDTQNWWPGRKVLISPHWVNRVSWSESKVYVDLTRDKIRHSPVFTSGIPLTRDYEAALHRHYSRKGYWIAEEATGDKMPGLVRRGTATELEKFERQP